MKNALVFGAGKIARGFIGQLLYRSGYSITFAEYNADFARRLNEAGRYYVNVMGNPRESEWISNYKCIDSSQLPMLAEALKEADIVFTSVIGKNLPALGKQITKALVFGGMKPCDAPKTIVTCENWKNPSAELRNAILEAFDTDVQRETFDRVYGVSEAVVMRSAVEATEEILRIDPLAVSVHDFWMLPIDESKTKGPRQDIRGLVYKSDFRCFLQQKVYTYNGGNATIAYHGALKGFRYLFDAANDPEILQIVDHVYKEINQAVSIALEIPLSEQEAFSKAALAKYRDYSIVDFVERHARDPIRKLGPDDRIVGVAKLIESVGLDPYYIAGTLAAALYYESGNSADPSAESLRKLREREGIAYILKEICGIDAHSKLMRNVHVQIDNLKERGWIHE